MRAIFTVFILLNLSAYPQSFLDTFYVNPGNTSEIEDGTSWETGWTDFTKFDINDNSIGQNSLLLIGLGNYSTGHSSYTYNNKKAIILISNKRDITLRRYDSGENKGAEQVYFSPDENTDIGIWLQPTDTAKVVHKVTIEGIYFRNFSDNAILVSGYDYTHRVDTVLIKGCDIRYPVLDKSLFCQRSDHITIESCTIFSEITENNNNTQNDGIFMQNVSNVIIRNNNIIVANNYSPTSGNPHIDGIQITKMGDNYYSSNILIENNTCQNLSDVSYYEYNQGIHITYTSGYIKIFNNIIRSKIGDGLVNIHYMYATTELKVYNNTFYAEGDQRSIVQIVYYPIGENSSYVPFYLLNNIFYKANSNSAYALLKFANVDTAAISQEILNHNLYFIDAYPTVVYRTSFSTYNDTIYSNEYTVNWDYDDWENDGKSVNPLFTSSSNLTLQYNSGAKNIGKGLSEIQKDYYGNDRPYWNNDYDAGSYEIEDTQLKIGAVGVGTSQSITHYLKATGTYWEKSSSNWTESSDQYVDTTFYITVGNADSTNLNSWRGWEYKWLDRSNDDVDTSIAAGFYKVSNSLNSNAYFYIDLRDAVSSYSINIWIMYVVSTGIYKFHKNNSWNTILNGSIVRIWDINSGTHNTLALDSYWRRALIPLAKNNHPWLVWGPYDSTGVQKFRVYRQSIADSPWVSIKDSLATTIYEYIDTTKVLASPFGTPGHYEWYKIAAIGTWAGERISNKVEYEIDGKVPKRGTEDILLSINYNLDQNYPNPFNPVTKIPFSVSKEEEVSLIVYDILGREIKRLVDQALTPGKYEVTFNGGDLSSGVYFYQVRTKSFTAVKKMQIIK